MTFEVSKVFKDKVFKDNEKSALIVSKSEDPSCFSISVVKACFANRKYSKLRNNSTWLFVEDGKKLAEYIEDCMKYFEGNASKAYSDALSENLHTAFFCDCIMQCCAISIIPWRDGDKALYTFKMYSLFKKRTWDSCSVDLTKEQAVDLISFLR